MKILAYATLVLATVGCYDKGWSAESVDLGIEMQPQQTANWCWAAVGQAIGQWRGENVTQSEVASFVFKRECTPSTCDKSGNFKPYIQSIGLGLAAFAGKELPDDDQMHSLIEGGKPLVVTYVDRRNGGAHVVIVGGYKPEGYLLYDSLIGPEPLVLESLDDYRDGVNLYVAQVMWVTD